MNKQSALATAKPLVWRRHVSPLKFCMVAPDRWQVADGRDGRTGGRWPGMRRWPGSAWHWLGTELRGADTSPTSACAKGSACSKGSELLK